MNTTTESGPQRLTRKINQITAELGEAQQSINSLEYMIPKSVRWDIDYKETFADICGESNTPTIICDDQKKKKNQARWYRHLKAMLREAQYSINTLERNVHCLDRYNCEYRLDFIQPRTHIPHYLPRRAARKVAKVNKTYHAKAT